MQSNNKNTEIKTLLQDTAKILLDETVDHEAANSLNYEVFANYIKTSNIQLNKFNEKYAIVMAKYHSGEINDIDIKIIKELDRLKDKIKYGSKEYMKIINKPKSHFV